MKRKVYIETSVPSFYHTTRTEATRDTRRPAGNHLPPLMWYDHTCFVGAR
jgi:hypothetical protein